MQKKDQCLKLLNHVLAIIKAEQKKNAEMKELAALLEFVKEKFAELIDKK